MYAKPRRLLEALDKVRNADAVAQSSTGKSSRLAQALEKVKEAAATEAVAVSVAPRTVKAFTRMKVAVAEANAADDVMKKLRRVNKMSVLTADVVRPKSPAEVKLPSLREPEKPEKPEKVNEEKSKNAKTDGYFRLIVQTGPVEPAGPYRERTPRLPYVEQKRSIGKHAAVGSSVRVGTRTNEKGETVYTQYCGWAKDKYGRVYATGDGETVVIKSFNEDEGTYMVDIANPPADEPWYNIRCLRFHADCLREL